MDEREEDALTIAAIVLGGFAALWLATRLVRFAFRVAGPVSTAMTVLGAVMWLREQLRERDEERA